jgi:hypothetical protein
MKVEMPDALLDSFLSLDRHMREQHGKPADPHAPTLSSTCPCGSTKAIRCPECGVVTGYLSTLDEPCPCLLAVAADKAEASKGGGS